VHLVQLLVGLHVKPTNSYESSFCSSEAAVKQQKEFILHLSSY
jgi:hypothetical protein